MARKQIVLTTDTVANMISKINTMGTHVGDLDGLNAGVPLDSDVVQVLNALYDSIGDYDLALNTDAQTLKGGINELQDSIGYGGLNTANTTLIGGINDLRDSLDSAAANIMELNSDRDSDEANIMQLNSDRDSDEANIMTLNSNRDSAAAAMNQLMLDRDSDEANIMQLNQDRDSAAAVMNQLMQDRDSDDGKAQELDSNQTFLLHVIGTGVNTLSSYDQATQTYSGDITTFDDSISDKSGIVPAINDIQGQITQIKAAAGLSEGNVGSLSNLQDPIEGASVVASINLLRDSVQAMQDSLNVGGLTIDQNQIGTSTGVLSLHDGAVGNDAGTVFAKFEKYKDSDLKISGGDAGTTAIIIADSSVTVEGNLRVRGTTTTVNSETITVDDNILELNSNTAATPTENGGIEINRGSSTNAQLIWNEGTDSWQAGLSGSLKGLVLKGDIAPVATAMIQDDAVTNAKLRNSAEYSVIGKATSGAGAPADIALAANSFLGRSGTGNVAGTTLSNNSVIGKAGTNPAGTVSVGSNNVLGRVASGDLGGITIDNNHISASAGIVNSKLANSSITVNSVTIALGGSGTIDIAGGIDSLGAVSGIITAGVGGNESPIVSPQDYGLDDSSQAIIIGHHPELVNPASDNLPARSVLIGWHAGSKSDEAADNDGQLHNVMVGYLAGYNNDAREITALGAEAMGGGSLTSADGHTAVGYKALYETSTSTNNVGIGNLAGAEITSGGSNVAIGYRSGPGNAGGSAQQNVFIGADAGKDGTTGTNNTVLGYNAQKSGATANNEFTFGNASVTKWRFPGVSLECTTKTFIYASDGSTVLRTFLTGTS